MSWANTWLQSKQLPSSKPDRLQESPISNKRSRPLLGERDLFCVSVGKTKSGSEVAFLLPQIIGFQDDTNYVAIGGVTPENIPEFRKAGCLGVGLASSLMPKDKAAARDWDACAEYVHMLLTKAKGE